jgi:hypothetical protein
MRSQPLPQALPRPQPLPTTRTRAATGDLTNIEASLAHAAVRPQSGGELSLDSRPDAATERSPTKRANRRVQAPALIKLRGVLASWMISDPPGG